MAAGETQRSNARRLARGLSAVLGPLAALACVIAFFAIAERARGGDTFLSVRNLQTVANQTAPLIVAALGMTVIIISGGIDLSAGSALALSACVMARLLVDGYSPWLAVAGCLAAGALCGLVNGIAVSLLRVVPFIVTLGTMTIYLGIAKIMAGDGSIRPEKSQFPVWREAFVYPVPPQPWLVGEWLPNFALGVWLALGLSVWRLRCAALHGVWPACICPRVERGDRPPVRRERGRHQDRRLCARRAVHRHRRILRVPEAGGGHADLGHGARARDHCSRGDRRGQPQRRTRHGDGHDHGRGHHAGDPAPAARSWASTTRPKTF